MDYTLYILIAIIIIIVFSIIFLPKIVKDIFIILISIIILYFIFIFIFQSIGYKIDKTTNTNYNSIIIKQEIKIEKKIKLEIQKIRNWIEDPAPNATKRLEDHYKNIDEIKKG